MVREFKHNGDDVHLRVDPGVCGFPCTVSARKLRGRVVELWVEGSDCRQTQRLSEFIGRMEVRDILRPATVNPIFVRAEKAGCCASCPVPTALIKAAEVALGLALELDIIMHFQT